MGLGKRTRALARRGVVALARWRREGAGDIVECEARPLGGDAAGGDPLASVPVSRRAALALPVLAGMAIVDGTVLNVAFASTKAYAASVTRTRLINGEFNYFVNVFNTFPEFNRFSAERWTSIDVDRARCLNTSVNYSENPNSWRALPGFNREAFAWRSTQGDYTQAPNWTGTKWWATAGSVEIQRDRHSGNYYCELCPEQPGSAIYQDIKTTPGAVYKWQLDHCSISDAHIDTMQVRIGAPGREAAVGALRTTVNGSGDTKMWVGTTIPTHVPGGNQDERGHEGLWERYEGNYECPTGQAVTRFTFKSLGEPGVRDYRTIGNLIDNVQFYIVYRLTYDMNGGQGGPASSRKAWVGGTHYEYYGYQGEATTAILAKSPAPTRDDCDFVGWSNSRHDPIAHDAKAPGDVIDSYKVAGHKTVYAVWRWKAHEVAVWAEPMGTRGRRLPNGYVRLVNAKSGKCVTYGNASYVLNPDPRSPKSTLNVWNPYDDGAYGQLWFVEYQETNQWHAEVEALYPLGNAAMAVDSTKGAAGQRLAMYPRAWGSDGKRVAAQTFAFDLVSDGGPTNSLFRIVPRTNGSVALDTGTAAGASQGTAVFLARRDGDTQRWRAVPYDPYTRRRVDRVPNWPRTTCAGMWFGLYSDQACTHELERRQMPKGSTWFKFKTKADRSKTYYVKAITQPVGCWADWLARPVSGYDGGCARLAPVTNSYTVTFQRRMEGGGLFTISTARVFWHDSATAPTPPAVDGYDAHGAWRQTKGVGGIGALTSVTEDLTYELAYMRRRTVSFVALHTDSGGRAVTTTLYSAKVKYGSTVKSTDGIFATALQKAREKFNVGGNKPIDYSSYWHTGTNVSTPKYTSSVVKSDLTVYLYIPFGTVVWYCDGNERQRKRYINYGTWIPANDAALESRIKLPNCTPGWRGWYLDEMAPSLHPELSGVASASTFSATAARASDAKFAGTYLNAPLLKLWSANLATTRFAYADGSVHVPEGGAHYYPSTVSGEHETNASTLRLPASDVRGVSSTLPLRHYSTAYQLLGDGTGRWRTLRPDAWHARADVSDRAFSAMTVHADSTVYVKWTQVTADGVVDERA